MLTKAPRLGHSASHCGGHKWTTASTLVLVSAHSLPPLKLSVSCSQTAIPGPANNSHWSFLASSLTLHLLTLGLRKSRLPGPCPPWDAQLLLPSPAHLSPSTDHPPCAMLSTSQLPPHRRAALGLPPGGSGPQWWIENCGGVYWHKLIG